MTCMLGRQGTQASRAKEIPWIVIPKAINDPAGPWLKMALDYMWT